MSSVTSPLLGRSAEQGTLPSPSCVRSGHNLVQDAASCVESCVRGKIVPSGSPVALTEMSSQQEVLSNAAEFLHGLAGSVVRSLPILNWLSNYFINFSGQVNEQVVIVSSCCSSLLQALDVVGGLDPTHDPQQAAYGVQMLSRVVSQTASQLCQSLSTLERAVPEDVQQGLLHLGIAFDPANNSWHVVGSESESKICQEAAELVSALETLKVEEEEEDLEESCCERTCSLRRLCSEFIQFLLEKWRWLLDLCRHYYEQLVEYVLWRIAEHLAVEDGSEASGPLVEPADFCFADRRRRV